MTELLTRDLADFYRGVERMYGQSMNDDEVRTCPYCKKLSHMIYVNGSARLVNALALRVEAAFQCTACKRFVIGGSTFVGVRQSLDGFQHHGRFISEATPPAELFAALEEHDLYWEPISPVGKEYPDVPAEIAAPADEAYRCYSIGAHRAAVLMARAVIEASAKSHGVTTGVLAKKIDAMGDKGVIRPILIDAAHEIRHVGNDMAHGDFATSEVTADDALDVLELMDDILAEAFVLPQRINRRRERRAPKSD